jgi:flagellar hook-basal body complex protein FliE
MSLIGSISGLTPSTLSRLPGMMQPDGLTPVGAPITPNTAATPGTDAVQPGGFGQLFDNLVSAVDAKQTEATQLSRQVLLGQNDQLHQSVIAMQEASVAFSLMVQVRNKLVESYQELMRMPV